MFRGLSVVISDLDVSACVNVEFKYHRNLQLFLTSQHTCSRVSQLLLLLYVHRSLLGRLLPTFLLTTVQLVTLCQRLV